MSFSSRLNLKNAEFDQETYSGRVLHFCKLTDQRNALLTDSQLQIAKDIVTRHQKGELAILRLVKQNVLLCYLLEDFTTTILSHL